MLRYLRPKCTLKLPLIILPLITFKRNPSYKYSRPKTLIHVLPRFFIRYKLFLLGFISRNDTWRFKILYEKFYGNKQLCHYWNTLFLRIYYESPCNVSYSTISYTWRLPIYDWPNDSHNQSPCASKSYPQRILRNNINIFYP